jgi:hypothetical protein
MDLAREGGHVAVLKLFEDHGHVGAAQASLADSSTGAEEESSEVSHT